MRPTYTFLLLAGVCLAAGWAYSAYHASWVAGATRDDSGEVIEGGPIPVVKFQPDKTLIGEWARVDTINFVPYSEGQRVVVLYKTYPQPPWEDRPSIAGDRPLATVVSWGAAYLCLLAAFVSFVRARIVARWARAARERAVPV